MKVSDIKIGKKVFALPSVLSNIYDELQVLDIFESSTTGRVIIEFKDDEKTFNKTYPSLDSLTISLFETKKEAKDIISRLQKERKEKLEGKSLIEPTRKNMNNLRYGKM